MTMSLSNAARLMALVLVAGAIWLLLAAKPAEATSDACYAAEEFVGEQLDSGLDILTWSPEEIAWVLRYTRTSAAMAQCEDVPEALQMRMRGEFPQQTWHLRMNCHIAHDRLVRDAEELGVEELDSEEFYWAQEYVELAQTGEPCPEPPMSLKLRSVGHDIDTQQGRQAVLDYFNAGDAEATLELAMMFFHGKAGAPVDAQLGLDALTVAVERGSPWAKFELAEFYNRGMMSDGGPEKGLALTREAAEAGIPQAARALGNMYAQGQGVKENHAEAVKWFRMAAENGEPRALVHAARYLYEGKGMRNDKAEAARVARIAATGGDTNAMAYLVGILLRDREVRKKEDEVWYWLDLAASRGNAVAIDFKAQHGTDLDGWFNMPPPERYRPKRQYCPIKSSCVRYVHHQSGTSFNSCNTGPDYWNCRDVE